MRALLQSDAGIVDAFLIVHNNVQTMDQNLEEIKNEIHVI